MCTRPGTNIGTYILPLEHKRLSLCSSLDDVLQGIAKVPSYESNLLAYFVSSLYQPWLQLKLYFHIFNIM